MAKTDKGEIRCAERLAEKWADDTELDRIRIFGVPITEVKDRLTLRRFIWLALESGKPRDEQHALTRKREEAFLEKVTTGNLLLLMNPVGGEPCGEE